MRRDSFFSSVHVTGRLTTQSRAWAAQPQDVGGTMSRRFWSLSLRGTEGTNNITNYKLMTIFNTLFPVIPRRMLEVG